MSMSPAAQRVQAALAQHGFALHVLELPASTRTAQEAARAVNCDVGQIVKSLIFRGIQSGEAYLVETSGANRVSEARLSELVGEPIEKAGAAFVRAQTGFSIGGVPPVGHLRQLRTLVDADLLEYERVWAAAGTPHSLFALSPDDLLRLTGGQVASLKADP